MYFIENLGFLTITLVISSFLIAKSTSQVASISCNYSLFPMGNNSVYECDLSITNPLGFDNFTRVLGEHLAGFGDENVTQIYDAFGVTRNIPQIICNQFKNLEFANLGYLRIEELNENSLRNCKQLEGIFIDGNDIHIIHEKAFASNNKLKNLYMPWNQIRQLPENVFANLTELEFLEISSNPLQSLPNRIFSSQNSLRSLGLGDLGITWINPQWFQNLNTLGMLRLFSNRISAVPEDAFGHLVHLTLLDLRDNPLNGNIPHNLFRNLTKLEELNLERTGIQVVSPNWFQSLNNLRRLNLNYNQITSIPENMFERMGNMTILYLSRNNLTERSIPAGTFDNLPRLTDLNLNYNQIENLNPRWFANLQNLVMVQLTDNRIESIPVGVFQPVAALSQLYLGVNNLKAIDRNAFGNLSYLTSVYIQGNQIVALDRKFFNDATRLNIFNFLNNSCASVNIRNFQNNPGTNLQYFSRCIEDFEYFAEFQSQPTPTYTFFNARLPGFHIQIRTSQNAHITLSNTTNANIEILIGAVSNTRTLIRVDETRIVGSAETPNILNENEWRVFRVTWVNNIILVFRDDEEFPFMAHMMVEPFRVNFYGLRSPESHAAWRVWPIGN